MSSKRKPSRKGKRKSQAKHAARHENVPLNNTNEYVTSDGVKAVSAQYGSHTIHRTGNNYRAALAKVQKAMNKFVANNSV